MMTSPAQTVHEAFARSAARFPDRPCIHIPAAAAAGYAAGPVDYSYAQAAGAVDSLARAYAAAGYGLGHRVAVALDNRAEAFLHYLALNSLGVSMVPVSADLGVDEKAYLIGHSDALLLVALPTHEAAMRAALAKLDRAVPLCLSGEPFAPPPAASPAKARKPDRMSEASLLYTSGTTGKPKGCILSNDYTLAVGELYVTIGGHVRIDEGRDRLITPLPLNHMNALCCSFTAMLLAGGCIIQLDRFHPKNWWDTVRASRATILHYLGVMPAMLLGAAPRPDDDFSDQIKFCFGAGVDPRHQANFEARFKVPLIEAWSMTEVGAAGWISAHEEPRHVGQRCFGKKPDYLDYRLVDEAGQDVAPGQPGELLIRAAGPDPRKAFFSGYYKDQAATDAAWAGGWFHTGDVVRVAEDGSFHFVDRRKNVIRRSGENIAAVEVESAVFTHASVAAAAVCPVPDEVRGEEVMACVVLKPGEAPSDAAAAAIQAHVMEKLIYFKAPGYVAFLDALPMTASQKVQRGELKTLAQTLVEQGRCHDLRGLKRRRKIPA